MKAKYQKPVTEIEFVSPVCPLLGLSSVDSENVDSDDPNKNNPNPSVGGSGDASDMGSKLWGGDLWADEE